MLLADKEAARPRNFIGGQESMMDDTETLKSYLESYVNRITRPSKNGFYECPLCGSGTHTKATGAFRIDNDKLSYKCFSCGSSGDIFELIGAYENISDFSEQKKRARELFAPTTITNSSDSRISQRVTPSKTAAQEAAPEPETDYTALYTRWNKQLNMTEYTRGITRATLDRFSVGYCEDWRHPKRPRAAETPRLIIPTSRYSYIARLTREEKNDKENRVEKVGRQRLFNEEALTRAQQPICIVEGEIDALSIIDAGGEAVGLGGTSGVNKLIIRLSSGVRPKQPLILALDNDEAGKAAQEKLQTELEALTIKCKAVNLYGTHKDANEALQSDRAALEAAISGLVDISTRDLIENSSNLHFFDEYIADLNDFEKRRDYKTGLSNIDEAIDGGLHEGLTILGAMSSAGKTTLILQIADNLSKRGEYVLFFSLEMSKFELMSKSVSRLTYKLDETPDHQNAKTVRGLYRGARTDDERGLMKEALDYYRDNIAAHLFVYEGAGTYTADKIAEEVEKFINTTGHTPVVFVDYLQIIAAPKDMRATDKQIVDYSIRVLKQLSRDNGVPLVVISSYNRSSYKEGADMTSFKESGGIEYSSDVLLALQFEGMDDNRELDIKAEKGKLDRDIELVVLKNRNGAINKKAYFTYHAAFNLFEPK